MFDSALDSLIFNDIIRAYVYLSADAALEIGAIDEYGADTVKGCLHQELDKTSAMNAFKKVYGRDTWKEKLAEQHNSYTAQPLFEE